MAGVTHCAGGRAGFFDSEIGKASAYKKKEPEVRF